MVKLFTKKTKRYRMKTLLLTSFLLASIGASASSNDGLPQVESESTYLVEVSTFHTETKKLTRKLSFDVLDGDEYISKGSSLISGYFEPEDNSSDAPMVARGIPSTMGEYFIAKIEDNDDSLNIQVNYSKIALDKWLKEPVDGGVLFTPKLVQSELNKDLNKDLAFAPLNGSKKCKEMQMQGDTGETFQICVTPSCSVA